MHVLALRPVLKGAGWRDVAILHHRPCEEAPLSRPVHFNSSLQDGVDSIGIEALPSPGRRCAILLDYHDRSCIVATCTHTEIVTRLH
eukprot:scaffold148_cov144-Isochrysis_galbana.AAC.11